MILADFLLSRDASSWSWLIFSGPGGQKSQEDEHVYEEINESKSDEAVISSLRDTVAGGGGAGPGRRAKWTEQNSPDSNMVTHNGGGDAPANPYATRPPPKPLPRRNVSSGERF